LKILDLYILKKFLTTFFFVVLLFVVVISVIDFTEKNDDFIKNHAPFLEILKYYLTFMPYIGNLISPITIFIATVFVTANMAAHTEVIAILSSGVSFKRMMLPYIIGSLFIGMLTFVLIEWVIPNGNKKRVAFENQYVKNEYFFVGDNTHLKIAPNTYAYLLSYNNSMNIGYQFSLETIEGTKLKSKLKANRILWQDKKNVWELDNYVIRKFNGEKEELIVGAKMDTVINLHPKDFGSQYLLHETFTMSELDNYIAELKERGAENIEIYLTEKYERFTYPFAIVILTVIGVIVSARKTREGAGFQIAFGFLLAFIYILFVLMSRGLAGVGFIGPLLASWIPNIVFSSIGLLMYKTVPK
jgi:lipopolysaccharide export system permease protein